MDAVTENLKPCPFCGGTDIRFSIKTTNSHRNEHKYHVAMYCNDCNCYGKRELVTISSDRWISRTRLEKDWALKEVAMRNWNERKTNIDKK